jgi:cyclopropane fatty-acyl-phospholipid synthase-like methyltransferase
MKKRTNRLYKDLAWLWPLWEDLDIYKKECKKIVRLIRKHSKIKTRTLLDIGCGGGKNASHFKKHFDVTGIDLSRQMLRNARKINPECKFIIADMRNFDLKKQFDSVFINDAHNYMTTQRDLLKTFKMAYKHLKLGGVMLVHPDQTKSTFKQNATHIWRSKRGDMDITFIENNYDPNLRDNTFESTFVFLIRKKGKLRIEHDFHTGGLFTLEIWRKLLKQTRFKVYKEKDEMTPGVPTFVCLKQVHIQR